MDHTDQVTSNKYYNWVNPFVPNPPFLYPLKTSENRKVFWCFQGVEKGCIGNEWVKQAIVSKAHEHILFPFFRGST